MKKHYYGRRDYDMNKAPAWLSTNLFLGVVVLAIFLIIRFFLWVFGVEVSDPYNF
jgi:hypothetical protein